MDFGLSSYEGIVKPSRSRRPCAIKDEDDSVPSPKSEATTILVKQIQRAMGGQSALRGITSPAAVRNIVLNALASLRNDADNQVRIRSNKLSSIERAAVRIVTNRGAAMRSRQRQRRFVGDLMLELENKQGKIKELESELDSLKSLMMLLKWETERHGVSFPYFDFDQAALDFGVLPSNNQNSTAEVMTQGTSSSSTIDSGDLV